MRFSLGAMIRLRSGCGLQPSLASTSWGRSAASRKVLAPASAHGSHRQHEHQAVAPTPFPPRIRDLREHL
jgi:hypothetical protein